MGVPGSKGQLKTNSGHAYFFVMALIRLRVTYKEAERRQLRILEANRSLLGESRTGFRSHRECMEEVMNMLMSWENKVGKYKKDTKNHYKSRAFYPCY